ncbi:MAG: response regulator, partial [Nitrospira sp.]|nr:response regulator [Nitrospira sp.]
MSPKILIVDDEPDLELLIQQKFRKKIREKEFQFIFAHNGIEALEKLQADPEIDLVLTDINMPEMDGLALLARLHDLSSVLKAVIVSAYGDMGNIRTAMNRGAVDFLTKPIDFQDLEITINKTLQQVQQLKESLRLREKFIALQQELDIARRIQQSILPENVPNLSNLNVQVRYLP